VRRTSRRDWDTLLGDAITDTHGHTRSVAASDKTKSKAGTKARRKRQRKKATYKQEVKPIIERLLTHMELILLTCMEEVADFGQEEEWRDAEYPALVRLFINKRGEFARWMPDAANREEAMGAMQGIKWAWDKRKPKPDIYGGEKHQGGS